MAATMPPTIIYHEQHIILHIHEKSKQIDRNWKDESFSYLISSIFSFQESLHETDICQAELSMVECVHGKY